MLHLSTVERTKGVRGRYSSQTQWPMTQPQPGAAFAQSQAGVAQFVHHSVRWYSILQRWHTFWHRQKLQKQQQAADKGPSNSNIPKQNGKEPNLSPKKTKNEKGSKIHFFFFRNFRCMFAAFCTFAEHFSSAGQNFLTCCSANWISPHRHCQIMANTDTQFVFFFIAT